MYVIRNVNYGNYYKKVLFPGQYHFVSDSREANIFKTKKEANMIFSGFKHKENFEIVKVVK